MISPTLTTSTPLPGHEPFVSELTYARNHLIACQTRLYISRKCHPERTTIIRSHTRAVLAALSWVWDAQERERHTQGLTSITINIDTSQMRQYIEGEAKKLMANLCRSAKRRAKARKS